MDVPDHAGTHLSTVRIGLPAELGSNQSPTRIRTEYSYRRMPSVTVLGPLGGQLAAATQCVVSVTTTEAPSGPSMGKAAFALPLSSPVSRHSLSGAEVLAVGYHGPTWPN